MSATTGPLNETPLRLLSLTEVKANVGFGKTMIYALIANNEFPKPLRHQFAGSNRSRCLITELVAPCDKAA